MLIYNLRHWNDPDWFVPGTTVRQKVVATLNDLLCEGLCLCAACLYGSGMWLVFFPGE